MAHTLPRFGSAILSGVGLLTILAGPVCPESSRIVIVSSQDLGPYQEVIAGFRQVLLKEGIALPIEVQQIQGKPGKAQEALADVKQTGARLVVTLGSTATQAAVEQAGETPLIAAMILTADDLRKTHNGTGVTLDFPLETQFRWMQRMLPSLSAVGVLYNAKENQAKVQAAAQIAKTLGLKLVPREVENPRTLPDALETVTRSADIVWGISDQVVMTPQTAESILLMSLRNKIPLTGLSASWVKAGALYALDRDYRDIGAQCGELAVKILRGAKASSLPPVPPRKVAYVLNLKTAGVMNLEFPPDVVSGAAQVFQ